MKLSRDGDFQILVEFIEDEEKKARVKS